MPIRRRPGTDANALAAAVEELEGSGEKVIQVIGQFGGEWAVLTERRPARSPREKRA
jgi:hypothetical protein